MSMTREDVLRELELLPVWQLRAPLLEIEKVPEQLTEKITPKIIETAPEATQLSQNPFEMHISDDKSWLFICPASRMDAGSQACTGMLESSGILFNNILSALHINKVRIYTQDLANAEVKIIVAMGEKTAQLLLNTQDLIDNLRGKTHILHGTPLIVTYSCQDLLEHLPNKAKTWDDLCTAKALASI
jgi:uracil-DNA glycosylase